MGGTAWFDFNGAGHPTDGIQGEIMVGTNPYPEVTGGGTPTPSNFNQVGEMLVPGASGSFTYIGGVQGIMVTLLDASGEIAGTTQTDGLGNYEFNNLVCSEYSVVFNVSGVSTGNGTVPSAVVPNAGSNDLLDSDGVFDTGTSTYITDPILLVLGEDDYSTDFGLTAGALPIVLKSFDGVGKNCKVELTWVTSSEKDNKGFIVERSLDGTRFSPIGSKVGKRNSSVDNAYVFVDDKIAASGYYYRLIQEDIDGTKSIIGSKYIGTSCEKYNQIGISGIYPNPVIGSMKAIMKYISNTSSEATMSVTSVDGKVIQLYQIQLVEGVNSFVLDLEMLPAGAYFIHVTGDGLPLSVKKLIKTE
jgi:hypothetical protein